MKVNLLPAVLLAGPPNCGKSVLAYLLTDHLRRMDVSHYLLRTAPDGEGNWFYEGEPEHVRTLRVQHKGQYTPGLVDHMHTRIRERHLPLLVDIGGKPRGDQFNILAACTHSVLLYRSEAERDEWRAKLAPLDLLPIAELRSSLAEPDEIQAVSPFLQATISGLQRDPDQRRTGVAFGALLDRVAGLCRYTGPELAQVHLRQAPFPARDERDLARQVGAAFRGELPFWDPADLPALQAAVPGGEPLALYGRGPVWLAAMLAAHSAPGGFAVFDIRYGWVTIPEILPGPDARLQDVGQSGAPGYGRTPVEVSLTVKTNAEWAEISLPMGFLEPGDVHVSPLGGDQGLVLSGRLPRWLFAGLARHFAAQRAWVGVYDPVHQRVIVVHSHDPAVALGVLDDEALLRMD